MTTASTSAGTASEGPRVVHVVTRWIGGSVRRVLDVVEAVEGHHTVLVGSGSDADRLPELAGRADVRVVESLVRQVSPRDDVRALAEVVAAARRLRPDVVHTHQAKAGLLGRVAARVARVPVVYHSASMASFGPGYGRRESAVFQGAERVTARLVDRTFVVGSDLAERLAVGAHVDRSRLTVVRSHVDRAAFVRVDGARRERGRRQWDLAPDAAVVAYVGSLDDRKQVTSLPGILAQVGRPITLVVAGTGPRHDELAASSTPEVEVRMLGHVDRVGDLMAATDLVALPSSAEGVPQVLVQAAMVGIPFVAYDVDGVGELRDLGAAGAVAPLGDETAFTAAVRRVLDGACAGAPGVPEGEWAAWSTDAIAAAYAEPYATDVARTRSRRRRRR